MIRVIAQPIGVERYAPFGALVAAGREEAARSANHGTAQAWDALAVIDSDRGGAARCTASLFRCHPWRGGGVLPIRRLERHPRSTQLFVPMRATRYLVVVAHGGLAPELETLAAFVVEGPQAITYAPGTWHHPMIALGSTADFVNVLHVADNCDDCHEVEVAEGLAEVELSGIDLSGIEVVGDVGRVVR